MERDTRFIVGDEAPLFQAYTTLNPEFRFGSLGGRYMVLSFLGDYALAPCVPVLEAVRGAFKPFFHEDKVVFCGVSLAPQDRETLSQSPFFYFSDPTFAISRLYKAIPPTLQQGQSLSYYPFTLVLDPNFRVIEFIPLTDPKMHNQRLEAVLRALPPVNDYADVPLHAPVLIIPRVFEPEFCETLIKAYKTSGGKESGTMVERGGYTVLKVDDTFKRRKDYTIEDEILKQAFRFRIERAVIPQLKKAFQFQASHIERYLIACYDSTFEGFFRPHRDNTTKGTAHRRFACTINLNAEGFEGGELRFPEYGSRLYKAPTGGAVVFSCSLLHEALPVTAGVRYATLPFFYDQSGAKIREENLQYLREE